MDDIISGTSLTKANTIGSWHDQNSIWVFTGKKNFRIKAGEILKALKQCNFKVIKKKKYKYLEVVLDTEDNDSSDSLRVKTSKIVDSLSKKQG